MVGDGGNGADAQTLLRRERSSSPAAVPHTRPRETAARAPETPAAPAWLRSRDPPAGWGPQSSASTASRRCSFLGPYMSSCRALRRRPRQDASLRPACGPSPAGPRERRDPEPPRQPRQARGLEMVTSLTPSHGSRGRQGLERLSLTRRMQRDRDRNRNCYGHRALTVAAG